MPAAGVVAVAAAGSRGGGGGGGRSVGAGSGKMATSSVFGREPLDVQWRRR